MIVKCLLGYGMKLQDGSVTSRYVGGDILLQGKAVKCDKDTWREEMEAFNNYLFDSNELIYVGY